MITNLMLLTAAAALQAPDPAAACALDDAGRRANAALSFEDFDQRGTLPSSARSLSNRGCWRQAAEATAHYLINGPIPTPAQQRVLLFHLGQQLAGAGEERRAADFVAAARAPEEEAPQRELNWNDFVRGTWAFLVKDRPMLIAARDAVLASPGRSNAMNGGLLAALERCFDRPYATAVADRTCRPELPR